MPEKLRKALSQPEVINKNQFDYLQKISGYVNDPETEELGRELVIRALAVRDAFTHTQDILTSLVKSVGLYPYLKEDLSKLNFLDHLAYELHRPENIEDDIVFHSLQFEVYHRLMRGENVILSAPTSSGKSLIIDALIASKKYQNIIIVVPTLALIDETRRRLMRRFANECKIITHQSQQRSAKADVINVYVLTQERVLERSDLANIDLFVMDEFYKIDFKENPDDDRDRTLILNAAFYKLAKKAKQFYLLGPNIEAVKGIKGVFEYYFKGSNFSTVAVNYERINLKKKKDDSERQKKLLELCVRVEKPILIYCQSPRSAHAVANELIKANIFEADNASLKKMLDWIKTEYHEDWIFYKALSQGIGIHHGSIPRALQQQCVRYFNEGKIKVLVCTSTFIEGVNSEAKSIIIYDRRISNNKPLDHFTYRNIEGRAGRMFRHFVGSVYSLEEVPERTSVEVDFPICHQDKDTSLDLLLQLDEEELTKESESRLQARFSEMLLPDYIVKQNLPVSIESQEAIAQEINSDIQEYSKLLIWSGVPEYKQLLTICHLICNYISKPKSIASHAQLELVVRRFFSSGGFTKYLRSEISNALENSEHSNVSDVIDVTLTRIRNVISYHFPRNLMVIENIQNHVFKLNGIESTADYSFYARALENLHMDSSIYALDEYGIPYQTTEKLTPYLKQRETLDYVLKDLSTLNIDRLNFTSFEKDILRQIQHDLAGITT